MPQRSPFSIILSAGERRELERRAAQYTSSYRDVVRAKLILLAAKGWSNKQIGQTLDVPRQIVSKWRKRFYEERLPGLEDKPRGGRPPAFSP